MIQFPLHNVGHAHGSQRQEHEDRDSDWIQQEEAAGIYAGEGQQRWTDFAIVVSEEPQIHVAIERPHTRNADRRIYGEQDEHDGRPEFVQGLRPSPGFNMWVVQKGRVASDNCKQQGQNKTGNHAQRGKCHYPQRAAEADTVPETAKSWFPGAQCQVREVSSVGWRREHDIA